MMKRLGVLIVSALFVVLIFCVIFINNINEPRCKAAGDWKLSWHDEFGGYRVSKSYWSFQKGGGGWGNNELQYYTDLSKNCYIKDGILNICAIKDSYKGYEYTSAKIRTKGKVDFLYGRIEIRAKLPEGKGLLPAIWMIPSQNNYHNTTKNGEIDLVEMIGNNPNVIYSGVHFYMRENYKSWSTYESIEKSLVDDFHIYAFEWNEKEMKWLIDDEIYFTFDNQKVFNTEYNPFDKSFYIIANIAVGGDWPGNPSDETILPARLQIDYIRYYKSNL